MSIVTYENELVGLGDAQTTSAIVTGAGGIASATISTPAVVAALGLSTSATALIAGPIIGAIVIALVLWVNRKGPHQKVATTKIVDEAEPILAQNRDAFLAGPKTLADKEFAIAVFNSIWTEVVGMCGQTQYGNPGKNCVSDRQRGGRWDWAEYYLDPILQTEAKPNPTIVGEFQDTLQGLVSFLPGFGNSYQIYLYGGIALLLLGMLDSKRKGDKN